MAKPFIAAVAGSAVRRVRGWRALALLSAAWLMVVLGRWIVNVALASIQRTAAHPRTCRELSDLKTLEAEEWL